MLSGEVQIQVLAFLKLLQMEMMTFNINYEVMEFHKIEVVLLNQQIMQNILNLKMEKQSQLERPLSLMVIRLLLVEKAKHQWELSDRKECLSQEMRRGVVGKANILKMTMVSTLWKNTP